MLRYHIFSYHWSKQVNTCIEERNFVLFALFVEPNVHTILNNLKLQHIYALSFYGSKIILDCPNYFDRIPIVLDGPNSFWSSSSQFGQIQIIKINPEKYYFNLTKINLTRPNQFGRSKIILEL